MPPAIRGSVKPVVFGRKRYQACVTKGNRDPQSVAYADEIENGRRDSRRPSECVYGETDLLIDNERLNYTTAAVDLGGALIDEACAGAAVQHHSRCRSEAFKSVVSDRLSGAVAGKKHDSLLAAVTIVVTVTDECAALRRAGWALVSGNIQTADDILPSSVVKVERKALDQRGIGVRVEGERTPLVRIGRRCFGVFVAVGHKPAISLQPERYASGVILVVEERSVERYNGRPLLHRFGPVPTERITGEQQITGTVRHVGRRFASEVAKRGPSHVDDGHVIVVVGCRVIRIGPAIDLNAGIAGADRR